MALPWHHLLKRWRNLLKKWDHLLRRWWHHPLRRWRHFLRRWRHLLTRWRHRWRHFSSWPADHTTEFGHTVINRYLYGLTKQTNWLSLWILSTHVQISFSFLYWGTDLSIKGADTIAVFKDHCQGAPSISVPTKLEDRDL